MIVLYDDDDAVYPDIVSFCELWHIVVTVNLAFRCFIFTLHFIVSAIFSLRSDNFKIGDYSEFLCNGSFIVTKN